MVHKRLKLPCGYALHFKFTRKENKSKLEYNRYFLPAVEYQMVGFSKKLWSRNIAVKFWNLVFIFCFSYSKLRKNKYVSRDN
jgi:hypothetical protein